MNMTQLLKLKQGDLIRLRGVIKYYTKGRDSATARIDNEPERFCTVIKVSSSSYRDISARTEVLSITSNANCEVFLNNEVVSILVDPDLVDLIESN